MRFPELDVSDKMPETKTIWHFRETLTTAGAADELFLVFRCHLKERGIITHSDSIVKASSVDRHKQNMSKEKHNKVRGVALRRSSARQNANNVALPDRQHEKAGFFATR